MKTNEYLIKRIIDLEECVIRLKKEINALHDFMAENSLYQYRQNHPYPEVDEE